MQKVTSFVAAAAFTAAFANASQAQDWSGRYVGGHIGVAQSSVDWTDTGGGWYTFAPGTTYEDEQDDTTVGGVQYGKLYQMENGRVWGWEIGFSATDHDNTITSLAFPASDTWNTTLDGMLSATARFGVARGQWLPYVEGGVALGNLGLRNVDSGFCAPPCQLDIDGWQPGLVLGLGVDYRVNEKVFVGLNYRHTAFETQSYVGSPTNRPPNSETYDLGGDIGVVTFRVNWLLD